MKLDTFVGENVDIICKDGRKFDGYYVHGFVPHHENYDPIDNIPDEDSIHILPSADSYDGIGLYESEIESITVVE